ncbi:MAG: DUF1800 domain-containing protein [Nostocaceae cyanobacterium CSU_2_110]|nr:DUF1800 domain-containing protein [Nostocaceae cyanobacterium CSU_2_110]
MQEQLNPSSIKQSSQLTTQLGQFDTLSQNSLGLCRRFKVSNNNLPKKFILISSRKHKELQKKQNKYKSQVIQEAKQAHITRAINSSRQLEEVMTSFWFNHFNVFANKKIVGFWLADYENDLRNQALGNFRDLLADYSPSSCNASLFR